MKGTSFKVAPVDTNVQRRADPLDLLEEGGQMEAVIPDNGMTIDISKLAPRDLEGQLKALIEKLKKLKQQNKELRDAYRTAEADKIKLETRVEELEQDNEMIVGQLQGQSEMLRNRVTVRIGGGDADAQRRKRGDEMRKALLSDDGMDEEEEDMQKTQRKTRGLGYLVRRVNAFVDRRMPFLNDIKLIQARYGHSVSAYFAFYYWLIVTYYWLGLASLALCLYHAFWLLGHGRSLSYLFMSSGVLPQLMVYSSFDPQERLMYVGMLLGFTLMLLAVALSKWVKEDRAAKSLDATEAELQNVKFAKRVLSVWDNGLATADDVQILQLSVAGDMVLLLEEKKLSNMSKQRGRKELALLYLRRFTGFCVYVSLQVASWVGIIVLTAQSATLSEVVTKTLVGRSASLASAASVIGSSLVPAAVSVINTFMPPLIQIITAFERWDTTNMTIKQLVVRMYAAKMLNVLIQVLSYTVLADPYLLSNKGYYAFRPSIAKPASLLSMNGAYTCRADQVGSGLYMIVLTEFVVSKIIAVGFVWAFELVAKYQGLPYKRAEFDIATKTVSLLYFHALTLATMPWAPLTTLTVVIFFQLSFKFDKAFLFKYEAKPARPWKAQDAGGFFIKFYLLTFMSVGFSSVYYFITNHHFPKSCDKQDDSIQLCASAVVDGVCALSPDNPWYDWFATNAGKSDYGGAACSAYPRCICSGDMACGPFAHDTSVYSALKDMAYSVAVFGKIFYQLTTNALISFGLFVGAVLLVHFRQNTIRVQSSANAEREKEVEASLRSLQVKVKRQAKTIQKLEASTGVAFSPHRGATQTVSPPTSPSVYWDR